MTTHPLELPAFLKRGKDNRLPKIKVKGAPAAKATPQAQVSPLDVLSPDARRLAEVEIKSMRARLSWFDDPATCEHYERLAAAPTADRVPHERKVAAIIDKKRLKEGLVGIATIAKDLKIIPRIARAALRGAKIAKPATGWNFPPTDVNNIKEKITSWLTKQSSKPPQQSKIGLKQQSPSSKNTKALSTGSSKPSTSAIPKKISASPVRQSKKSASKTSKRSAKTSGSSERAAKTAHAIETASAGTLRGMQRPASKPSKKRSR